MLWRKVHLWHYVRYNRVDWTKSNSAQSVSRMRFKVIKHSQLAIKMLRHLSSLKLAAIASVFNAWSVFLNKSCTRVMEKFRLLSVATQMDARGQLMNSSSEDSLNKTMRKRLPCEWQSSKIFKRLRMTLYKPGVSGQIVVKRSELVTVIRKKSIASPVTQRCASNVRDSFMAITSAKTPQSLHLRSPYTAKL